MDYHVYILLTQGRDTFLTGVTNNIAHCLMEQRIDQGQLVYFETYDRLDNAHKRESAIRRDAPENTIALVEALNPDWEDLYQGVAR